MQNAPTIGMAQLEILLNERDRPEPVTLWLITDPLKSRMRTGGRKRADGTYPNRFAGKVEKCTRYNGFIGVQYQRAVQNMRSREEHPELFEASALWNGKGQNLGRYFCTHVDRPNSRYLKFMPLVNLRGEDWGTVVYETWFRWIGSQERLSEADEAEAWTWCADQKLGSERQETDKPVAWNLPKLESVRMLKIGGQHVAFNAHMDDDAPAVA